METNIHSLVAGTYSFALSITDDRGATVSDTMVITVHPALAMNKAPTANAGDDIAITLPQNSAKCKGSGKDEDGGNLEYNWSLIAGPSSVDMENDFAAQMTINNLVQGVYYFKLEVTDKAGAIGRDTLMVTVNAALPAPNKAPIANAGADITTPLPINSVVLSGSGRDEDGKVESFSWRKIKGPGQYAFVNEATAETVIEELIQGIYTFELSVKDDKGAIGKDTVVVTVELLSRPVLVLNAGEDRELTLPNDSITLEAVVENPLGLAIEYKWSKISGPNSVKIMDSLSSNTSIIGLKQGVYRFSCEASDNFGNVYTDTVKITVKVLHQSTLSIFPNPATTSISVKIEANTRSAQTSLIIYNQMGKPVYAENFFRTSTMLVKDLPVSQLLPGIYVVEVSVDINNKVSTKFLKQ